MTMQSRLKIVPNDAPNDAPNADGRWIEIPDKLPLTVSWKRACDAVAGYVPEGFHVVAMERLP